MINLLQAAISGGTLLTSVMSQQYTCVMELYTSFTNVTLHENISSPYFYMYVRPKMIVHALTNRTTDIQEKIVLLL